MTIADAVRQVTRALDTVGIDDAATDARRLVRLAAGLSPDGLIRDGQRSLGADAHDRLAALLARRVAGEPVSRLSGHRAFWDLDLEIGPETLDPRPETEGVVEAVLAHWPADRPGKVLDLGTGSGCILLALAHARPNLTGLGIDCLPGAIEVARRNAAVAGLTDRVRFATMDWRRESSGIRALGPFDLIVSNPPYIPAGDIDTLAPEVRRYDPRAALDGGLDGLDAYRWIAPIAAALIAPGGWMVVEIGIGQAEAVSAHFEKAGLCCAHQASDLAGIPRILSFRPTKKGVGNEMLTG